MKYIVFIIALIMVIPGGFILAMSEKRLIRLVAFCVPFIAVLYEQTAINFFSHEFYRGSARGMEISASYLAILVLLLALYIKQGKLDWLPDVGSFIYLIYFFISVFSIVNADNLLYSFFEIWKMIMMYLTFIMCWNYCKITLDFEIFFIGIGSLILYNFVIVIKNKYLAGVYQAQGIFPHQNSMAMFLSMVLPVFLAWFMEYTQKWKHLFAFLVFAIGALSVIFTYSRGAMFCFPLGCAITTLLSIHYKLTNRKVWTISLLALLAFIGTMLVLPRVIERFSEAPEASKNTRINLAIAAKNMMDDKFFGVGINNWGIKINPPYEYSEHRDTKGEYDEDYKDAVVETVYLLVGAETGYFGLFIFLIWLWYYQINAFLLCKKLASTPYFYIVAGLTGGLFAAYLQSTLEWVLKQSVNFGELMLLIGMIGVLKWLSKRLPTKRRIISE